MATQREDEVLATVLAALQGLPANTAVELVSDADTPFARRLADALAARASGDGTDDGPAAVVHLRSGPEAVPAPRLAVEVDVRHPGWPVVRHVDAGLPFPVAERRRETQAFFAVRAAGWDTRFGDDLPAYHAAVVDAHLPRRATVADVGCGTGPALSALREAVGPDGRVLAVDFTTQMLDAVRWHGRDPGVTLLCADAEHLPLPDRCLDAVFAAGLLPHAVDPADVLRELARVVRPHGRLVLFHPSGRAALAARHGRLLTSEDALADAPLGDALDQTGWALARYEDGEDRFFAVAVRRPGR